MGIEKTETGWHADIRPGGREGKRFRKTFKTKKEALAFEAWARSEYSKNPEWAPVAKDTRRLSELIRYWYGHYGQTLKDGKNRLSNLESLCQALNDPIAANMTAQMFTSYRADRLASGISANTANHELAYLRALFNELDRLGEWSAPNPIEKVRQLKIDQTEMAFLTNEEIKALLSALDAAPKNKDAALVARVCLATGARWSEAEGLRAEQVQGGLINFTGTKSGKNRAVPISKGLSDLLSQQGKGKLFTSCYSAFREGMERAGINPPKGQLSHILRHTFASHFMQKGGNILALQRILGHASLTMTMRYAHLSPQHLQEVIQLNPLAEELN